ncbi:MAG TPA: cupin domain-containing protein [Woeseiaceae bacterium]|nr:cupin domain-containing protein [Woeseiaceae bacterium]
MSSARDKNGCDRTELLFEYALQTLPSSEVPVLEAHITACSHCRQEMETLRPIVDVFVSWPTDVLRPSASLWGRLAQRIAAETGEEAVSPAHEPWAEPEWEEVAPGISCKLLATDTEKDRVSMLVRLAPGAAYPPHRHAGVEELHLLHGELVIDDRKLYPGDYNRGEAGAADNLVWSETGCTCVLITSTRDVFF